MNNMQKCKHLRPAPIRLPDKMLNRIIWCIIIVIMLVWYGLMTFPHQTPALSWPSTYDQSPSRLGLSPCRGCCPIPVLPKATQHVASIQVRNEIRNKALGGLSTKQAKQWTLSQFEMRTVRITTVCFWNCKEPQPDLGAMLIPPRHFPLLGKQVIFPAADQKRQCLFASLSSARLEADFRFTGCLAGKQRVCANLVRDSKVTPTAPPKFLDAKFTEFPGGEKRFDRNEPVWCYKKCVVFMYII